MLCLHFFARKMQNLNPKKGINPDKTIDEGPLLSLTDGHAVALFPGLEQGRSGGDT